MGPAEVDGLVFALVLLRLGLAVEGLPGQDDSNDKGDRADGELQTGTYPLPR